MIKSIFLNFVFLFFGISIAYSQDSTATQNSLRSGTITSQFDYIYRVSNNFQEYEVVKKIKPRTAQSQRAGLHPHHVQRGR